ALIESDNDKIRSIGIHVHFEHFKRDLKKELKSLKLTGALPGTWTQETGQWVLKNVVHEHGLEKVLPLVSSWAFDKDPAVRRMLAEGLRPRGVWCKHLTALKRDPTPIKSMLEALLDDKSDYVRKAVANNLNDISKDNPDLLCDWIAEWSKGNISAERRWIIQRALRSLIKSGHLGAQKLMGLGDIDAVDIVWRKPTPKEIVIGQGIPFEIDCRNSSPSPRQLRLQLLMIGPGKNHKPRLAKYLLGELKIAANGSGVISKKVKFAHKNFVPKLPGTYRLQVHCNGKLIAERSTKYLGKDL
ncbi:MAG: DNA alkylation repair protein, partial [Candidatus Zixiibacteriota bacterium]